MALSNSQYDAIMREYGRRQMENQHALEARKAEIYREIPEVRRLEAEMAERSVACARRLLEGEKEALSGLRSDLSVLKERKARLIRQAGYPEDYLELHYRCPDCRDTGLVEGRKCHCFLQAQMKLLYAQSNLENVIERESFATLSFACYDDQEILPQLGITNRAYMKRVAANCRRFAEEFGTAHENLLFTGSTGVGKTFLTNCIAGELMKRGHSVIYLSAADLFEVFSKNKFDSEDTENMQEMYRFVLECELLIIDDLGTELNNSFTSSQLFYCINERMGRERSTIISTNLTIAGLRDSYTDRVASRIMSGYTIIPLYGRDLRLRAV
ncbi:MAG TPA: ATP-binding protein [Candidatus Enterocloster excrementipullorum]|uniref:ATP-binding protein n=1 Tax=Candidatus Enterocloster excrementipullorum TaxID=2838559 RepID=A0A9D2N0Z6_9FIRM|nr:ATP-binding protein [Candidatus Enterocloster excrementipullorum]